MSIDKKKPSKIMASMVARRDKAICPKPGYKCHSDSPYGDGYGDDRYGDSAE